MKYFFVDNRITEEEEDALKKYGKIIKCPACQELYSAISAHPDILMHILPKNEIVIHKNCPQQFINLLNSLNFKIYLSENNLEYSYPFNIPLNALSSETFFMHNLKYTDPILLEKIKNKKLINVKQGYTKCSTAIIKKNVFMTSDTGIYNSLININCHVLLLPPGDIVLTGLDYGFIGGTCGLIAENTLAFYGSLDYYKFGKEVLDFLKKHKVKPIYLRDGKLIDRGSILTSSIE
ncbi:DUF6873 family GME fold protein [Clostridium sp. DL1XJH146]